MVRMANGQLVLVTTERLGGGSPLKVVYLVAEEDPAKAAAIVAALIAPNEKVEALGPLPEAVLEALKNKARRFHALPMIGHRKRPDPAQSPSSSSI